MPRHPLWKYEQSNWQMQEAVVAAALPTTVLIHEAVKQLIACTLLAPVNVNSETAPTEFSWVVESRDDRDLGKKRVKFKP